MDRGRVWAHSASLVMAYGVVLFLIAVAHHASELLALDSLIGPALALALDGLPALAILYGGYRLSRIQVTPADGRRIVAWSFGAGSLFLVVMGATMLVRTIEGRTIAEPVFPLLIALESGAIAGLVAGYYNVRARADARRARTVSDALAFINHLVRHDLTNDLTLIKGYADSIADRRADGDDTGVDEAAVIAEQVDASLDRIETTRAIAETLIDDSDLEPVDLAAVTADLAAQVETTFGVEVTTDLPERALVTANDGVRSVVDNLLENAVEHNDADDPRIEVGLETGRDTVKLTITDNGPGIPDERKETLFETHEMATSGGGLSLVRTLVEAYGGTIRAEDNDPRGSRFLVELPRADRSRPAPVTAATSRDDGRPRRIRSSAGGRSGARRPRLSA